MSGRKVSAFKLQEEREKKFRLVQRIAGLRGEVEALSAAVEAALEGVSPGLRSTFSAEVAGARRWMEALALPAPDSVGMRAGDAALEQAHGELERAAADGRRLQESLAVAFTEKADEMARRLARRLAEVEGFYAGRRELLGLWFPPDRTGAWQSRLAEAKRLTGVEQYARAEEVLAGLKADVDKAVEHAEAQEYLHQKRLYVLKAVRQVCADMGFVETADPRYEREGDRGSAILFRVDTVNQGHIAFALKLDGISSFSEAAEGRCFEEFDSLSKFLEDEFGLQTEFNMADGSPRPALKTAEAKQLPKASGKQAQA
jgi:hypothetical protein